MLAFRVGAALLVIGGALVLLLLGRVSAEMRNPLAEAAEAVVARPAPALEPSRA